MQAFEQRDFKTPEDEAMYQSLIKELRCLVCQNQNIADSDADLAVDLRREIFTMIEAGDSKSDILDFMVQRYGEFVLYRPRFSTRTVVLWMGPACLFLLGIVVVWRTATQSTQKADNTPDEAAIARARDLLDSQE